MQIADATPEIIQLDVIVPTYNRSSLLRLTLDSLLRARIPDAMSVRIVVVDNNSKDDTRDVANAYQEKFTGRLDYIYEHRPGKTFALNTAIAATRGDIIGMIDDDEEVDEAWFQVIGQWMRDPAIDFIGGPYKPNWEVKPPSWLPDDCPAVIGIIDAVHEVRTYGKDFGGMLMGGNAVIRRSVLEKIGPYSTALGRTDKRLLSCEDEDMYLRILASGATGKYVPELIIYHHIPASRLTKSYHRRWFFWRGVSKYVLNQKQPEPVAHLFRVPRYLYGRAFRQLAMTTRKALTGKLKSSEAFSAELRWWDLAGWLYGRITIPNGP